MKWKKILISTAIGVAVATPLIAMLVIGSNPRLETASKTFLMDFKPLIAKEQDPNLKAEYLKKQEYLNKLKNDVNTVFTEYSKINKDNKLTLEYRSLKSSLTTGELNYFSELKKALLGINNNLTINLIPRSPVSVQEGFYQRNSDMVSFYWSPDYNGIGTWLTYLFGDFQIANVWPAIAAAINNDVRPNNENYNAKGTSWVNSLAENLSKIEFTKPNQEKVKLVTKTGNNYKALTYDELQELINIGVSSDSINTTIGNNVAAWITKPDVVEWGGTLDNTQDEIDGYYKENGGINNFVPSMQTNFLDYVSSFNLNIPNYQDGPNTRTINLVREGFHVPKNPNGTDNYRDWYVKQDQKNLYIEYLNSSPFESVTALNPSFTKSSTGTFFQTIFSTLFTWTIKHDYNSDATNGSNFDIQIVSQGAKASVKDVASAINNAINGSSSTNNYSVANVDVTIDPNDPKKFGISIPIRPILWVNAYGQTTDNIRYLSPIDFLIGIASYQKSLDLKINSNSYFIDLIGLDIMKTIEPLKTSSSFDDLINNSPTDEKKLTLWFNNPQLTGENIVDILSMQYFSALPRFSQKVKAILEIDETKPFNPQGAEWSQYYGAGFAKDIWTDGWYTTPYYLSAVNEQFYELQINKTFFQSFVDELTSSNYIQFQMNPEIDGMQYKKIPTLRFYYNKNGFPEQTVFEMFKAGETDKSNIPSSQVAAVSNDPFLSKQIYAPETLKLAKSDLIPYNLQVYYKNQQGAIELYDSNGNIYDYKNDPNAINVDKYGNLVFKEGLSPSLKSNIDRQYYDLIVKNFYTPIDAKDENGELLPPLERSSAIIRTAINDCINWLSLSSIVSSSQNKVMQNSFLPYGVASLPTQNGRGNIELAENRLKYWNISAYKLSSSPNSPIGLRMGGNLEWTILDYFRIWVASTSGEKE